MAFSSYWKEIAVILAGLFAIGSVLSDVKDKRTGQFTVWGKVFFTLTILSMIGGFYAQWADNAAEEKRNKEAQAGMLSLLQRTERSVYDLSRLLQTIEKTRIILFLMPDCTKENFKKFCDYVKHEGKLQAIAAKITGRASFSVKNINWTSWPNSKLYGYVLLYFFKDPSAAERFVKGGCLTCGDSGDMLIGAPVMSKQMKGDWRAVSVLYDTYTEQIDFMSEEYNALPAVHNDNILSIVDIPNSTIVLTSGFSILEDLTLTHVFIETQRGQTIEVSDPSPLSVGDKRVFVYHFDSASLVSQSVPESTKPRP
jgi:hypothetical protein